MNLDNPVAVWHELGSNLLDSICDSTRSVKVSNVSINRLWGTLNDTVYNGMGAYVKRELYRRAINDRLR